MVGFSKYEFYNTLLYGIILLKSWSKYNLNTTIEKEPNKVGMTVTA